MIIYWLVLFTTITSVLSIFPKMNAEEAFYGKPFDHGNPNETEWITSDAYVTIASCSYNSPFNFPVSGGSGHGVIVVPLDQFIFSNLSFVDSDQQVGIIELSGDAIQNPFGSTPGSTDHQSLPFEFHNVADDGATVRLTCLQSKPTNVVVIVRDDSYVTVNAHDAFHESGRQLVQLAGDVESESALQGQSHSNFHTNVARFDEASQQAIHFHHKQAGVLVLVHLQVRSADGKRVHRTIMTQTRKRPEKVTMLKLGQTHVDKAGDLVLKFQRDGLTNQPVKVHVRLGIKVDGSQSEVKECVDVSAIVEDSTLVVHNEWLRRCIKQNHLTDQVDGWDVVVMNATVTDPEDGYRVCGRLAEVVETGIRTHSPNTRRKLAAHPSSDEITMEMLQGRTPKQLPHHPRNLRSLSTKKVCKKILVHGYCSNYTFPTTKFTKYTVFANRLDPAAWSNDMFARKLFNFTKSLTGCGCIAHSQGGAACLHLLAHYHSCLDHNSTLLSLGRRIQSVGTPYQGTKLAGSAALLAQTFNIGCGPVNDLTVIGGPIWLKGIPLSARSKVYYYTTSVKIVPNRTNSCKVRNDVLLDKPNDGVTEKTRGQLPGGNNMGHTLGWCHHDAMPDPAQYRDDSRNAVMNAKSSFC